MSESRFDDDEEGVRPAFRVGFVPNEHDGWIALLEEVAEYGTGDTIEAALQDLLLSMAELRDGLAQRRDQLALDLGRELGFLESLPYLDSTVRRGGVHAVH